MGLPLEDVFKTYGALIAAVVAGAIPASYATHRFSVRRAGPHLVTWTSRLSEVLSPSRLPGSDRKKSGFSAKVVVKQGDHEGTFDGLFRVDIRVRNDGDDQLKDFVLDVYFKEQEDPTPAPRGALMIEQVEPLQARIVAFSHDAEDKHHSAKPEKPATPAEPLDRLAIRLSPFRRQEQYAFSIYVTVPEDMASPGELVLSTEANATLKRTSGILTDEERERAVDVLATSVGGLPGALVRVFAAIAKTKI